MNLQEYIDNRNITKYHLSKISGISQTTVIDICSDKISFQKRSVHTVHLLAKALNFTMEYIISLDVTNTKYDKVTGLPKSKKYHE